MWKEKRKILLELVTLLWASITISVLYHVLVQYVEIMIVDKVGDITDELMNGNLKSLKENIIIILGFILFSVGLLPILSYYQNKWLLSSSVKHDISIFSKFLQQKMSCLDKYEAGELLYRVEMDPIDFRTSFIVIMNRSIALCFLLFFSLFIMLKIHPLFSIICLLLSLLTVIIPLFTKKIYSSYLKEEKLRSGKISGIEAKSVQSLSYNKAHNISSVIKEYYSLALKNLFKHALKRKIKLQTFVTTTNSILSLLSDMFIYVCGSYLVSNGTITTGSVVKFLGITFILKNQLKNIVTVINNLSVFNVSSSRINSLVANSEESNGIVINEVESIRFDDVSFAYEGSDLVLDKINMKLEKGKKYALVGQNGSGKSTIAKVLMRLYDINNGKILVNGIEINEIDLVSIRNLITFVPQIPFIFDDTIENNILLGFDCYDLDLYKELLKEFDLEEEKDKRAGENGIHLSGGQKQKISLARALLKDNEVIIFDEPSSFLDNRAKTYITQYTKLHDKTFIIITHNKELVNGIEYTIYLDKQVKGA